jgi:3-isopropylmalate dehydrogenase
VSVALMLEYSAGEIDCARKIEAAVDAALNEGLATHDIGGNLGTAAMTDAIIKQFHLL